MADPSTKRFRVAFSFAGEKRIFVAQVARMLADRFGDAAILYDKFHEAEFANADLAFDLPTLLAGPSDRLRTMCDALRNFLEFTGRWDEWLALERDAEGQAVASSDFSNAGWRAYQTGWVHHLRGQPKEVLACADRAEAYWRETKASVRERAVAIRLRGIGHELDGNYSAAIIAYREYVQLNRKLNRDGEDVANGLIDLAIAELKFGSVDAAEDNCHEALRTARAGDYRVGVAMCVGRLAEVALARRDGPGAEARAREALALSENLGRRDFIAGNCRRLAQALARRDRKSEGLPHARRAVDIFTRLGSPELEAARATLRECES